MERLTRQRRAVVDALAHSGQALSPPDLHAMAQSSVPSLNLSTVYRQIRALEDSGEIVRVELPGQPARFEIASRVAPLPHATHHVHSHSSRSRGARQAPPEPAHHHHFHCVDCDRVYPIHACPGPMQDLAPPGFEVQRHDLTLRGRCAECAAGAAE
jgi:Fur family ferric uptake transcriptional regulator